MSRKITLIVRERDYAPSQAVGEPCITTMHLFEIECPELDALCEANAKYKNCVAIEVVGAEIKEQTNDE